MATYKLIQDIEAEDHILGPLTFRQFVFALIAVCCFYLSFLTYAKHVPFLMVIFLPPGLFFAFFAFPFGRDQPTEIWALARIRFLLKPHRRVWNQSGIKEMVTITAPKRMEVNLTNGLSQKEVRSRLQQLADTLDTRGWATKDATGADDAGAYINSVVSDDVDRLVSPLDLPQQVPEVSDTQSTDIMDEKTSTIAQTFQTMIDKSSSDHRKQMMDLMNNRPAAKAPATPQPQEWFMKNGQPGTSQPSIDEEALGRQLRASKESERAQFSGLRTLESAPAAKSVSKAPANLTQTPDPAILNWASRNDINISTIASEVNKTKGNNSSGNEVVVSLH